MGIKKSLRTKTGRRTALKRIRKDPRARIVTRIAIGPKTNIGIRTEIGTRSEEERRIKRRTRIKIQSEREEIPSVRIQTRLKVKILSGQNLNFPSRRKEVTRNPAFQVLRMRRSRQKL